MKMKLFICSTYYHTFITLIKALISGEKNDLYLFGTIPNCLDLKESLYKTGCFNRIYVEKIPPSEEGIFVYKNQIDRLMNFCKRHREFIKMIEKYAPVDFKVYDELYLFNDNNHIGQYFIMKDIPFHLLEDALDYYKYFDRYWSVNSKELDPHSFLYLARKIFRLLRWGQADCVLDIEVNEMDGAKIPKEKAFEVSRRGLLENLNAEQKLLIYKTFVSDKDIIHGGKKSVLLCTQPLFQDKFVASEREQLVVFESVIHNFSVQGFQIVIKPHPRDDIDYTDVACKYGCKIIDKSLPSEVLNFDPEIYYDAAVSITSTSINFLDFAKEKIFMGTEYIMKALENEKNLD